MVATGPWIWRLGYKCFAYESHFNTPTKLGHKPWKPRSGATKTTDVWLILSSGCLVITILFGVGFLGFSYYGWGLYDETLKAVGSS